jgi:hypothetical protein
MDMLSVKVLFKFLIFAKKNKTFWEKLMSLLSCTAVLPNFKGTE